MRVEPVAQLPLLVLRKVEAGNYLTEFRGYQVSVVQETTAYGDTGWNAYLYREHGQVSSGVGSGYVEEGQVTDGPKRTRGEALAVAVATVRARLSKEASR